MKIKTADLFNFYFTSNGEYSTYARLQMASIKGVAGYQFARTLRQLAPEIETLDAQRAAIIESIGINGQAPTPEQQQEFSEQWTELMASEIDIPVNPVDLEKLAAAIDPPPTVSDWHKMEFLSNG